MGNNMREDWEGGEGAVLGGSRTTPLRFHTTTTLEAEPQASASFMSVAEVRGLPRFHASFAATAPLRSPQLSSSSGALGPGTRLTIGRTARPPEPSPLGMCTGLGKRG